MYIYIYIGTCVCMYIYFTLLMVLAHTHFHTAHGISSVFHSLYSDFSLFRKRILTAGCLEHCWLSQDVKFMRATRLSTDKHRRFLARRKWQVSYLK